jgi:hypothetical protein
MIAEQIYIDQFLARLITLTTCRARVPWITPVAWVSGRVGIPKEVIRNR